MSKYIPRPSLVKACWWPVSSGVKKVVGIKLVCFRSEGESCDSGLGTQLRAPQKTSGEFAGSAASHT